jgi:hypothetical protein
VNRVRPPYPLHSLLRYQGEPTLRYLAEMCIKRAEALEQEATIERERGRRYLEAAEARAAEKQDRCQTVYQLSCRSNSSWTSTSRPPRRSALKCPRRWPAPTR